MRNEPRTHSRGSSRVRQFRKFRRRRYRRIIVEGLDRSAQTLKGQFDPLWENGEKERYMRSLEREDKARYREKMEKRAGV